MAEINSPFIVLVEESPYDGVVMEPASSVDGNAWRLLNDKEVLCLLDDLDGEVEDRRLNSGCSVGY